MENYWNAECGYALAPAVLYNVFREYPDVSDAESRKISTFLQFAAGQFAKGQFAKGQFAKGQFAAGQFAAGQFAAEQFAIGQFAMAFVKDL